MVLAIRAGAPAGRPGHARPFPHRPRPGRAQDRLAGPRPLGHPRGPLRHRPCRPRRQPRGPHGLGGDPSYPRRCAAVRRPAYRRRRPGHRGHPLDGDEHEDEVGRIAPLGAPEAPSSARSAAVIQGCPPVCTTRRAARRTAFLISLPTRPSERCARSFVGTRRLRERRGVRRPVIQNASREARY